MNLDDLITSQKRRRRIQRVLRVLPWLVIALLVLLYWWPAPK